MNEASPLLVNQSDYNDSTYKHNFKWVSLATESLKSKKDRFYSIQLGYVIMLMTSISFTISISSMWPFLQIVRWIIAAFSIGQLLASPLCGYWASKIENHKIPIIACIVLSAFANLLYAYLQSLSVGVMTPKYWMLFSRFLMGVGACCAAVLRSYVSGATSTEERTSALANLSASQGLGFIVGPLLQAILVPLKYPGFVEQTYFHLNFYTSPAFLSTLIYIALTLLLLFKFNEYRVLNDETENLLRQSDEISSSYKSALKSLPSPDTWAILSTLSLFFICCFTFTFYETLSSPLTIDMYAWTKPQATLYNGILLGVFGLFGVIVILFTKYLAKRFPEKNVLALGYILSLIASIALLPWGTDYPSVQIPTISPGHRNHTMHPVTNVTTLSPPTGCPLDYSWCAYTPIVQFWQYILGVILLVTGYSISNVMTFVLYSKLLGPWPQGKAMGILTSVGSSARAIGPISVSYLYGVYGPRVSFIFLTGILAVSMAIILFTHKRFVPYRARKNEII